MATAKTKLKRPSKVNHHNPRVSVPQVQTFRSRRTLAEHVRDNMLCAGKSSYHQRVIFVASHIDKTSEFMDKLVNFLDTSVKSVNLGALENVTGIMIFYHSHSVYMLEGSEKYIGAFIRKVANERDTYYKCARMVLVYNNINQRFFDKIIIAFGEPPILIQKNAGRDVDQLCFHNELTIKKVIKVCHKVNDLFSNENEPQITVNLPPDNCKLLPEAALIEYVLKTEQLLSIEEFSGLFQEIPEFQYYNEEIWPIPFDFTPNNVYDWGRYDINLIFGTQKIPE